jgi:hypothetical protein
MDEDSYVICSGSSGTILDHIVKFHTVPERKELVFAARQRLCFETPIPLLGYSVLARTGLIGLSARVRLTSTQLLLLSLTWSLRKSSVAQCGEGYHDDQVEDAIAKAKGLPYKLTQHGGFNK